MTSREHFLQWKGKPTDVIIPKEPTYLRFDCSPLCLSGYGASTGLLWATGLCDHVSGRGFCHRRTRRDRFAPEFLSRASERPLSVLDWRDQYRGTVPAVFANPCRAVSPGGQALGSQGVFYSRPLSKPHPLC